MALPNILKNFNFYPDGVSLMGVCEEVSLPKLSRKTETFSGGGLAAPVDIDIAQEKIEIEWTCAGFAADQMKLYAKAKASATPFRFAGAYVREDTEAVQAVEIVCRGRVSEIDPGNAKVGDKNTTKFKAGLTYYKLVVDGATLIEIDALAMIFIVDGVDILEKQRKAIGLA